MRRAVATVTFILILFCYSKAQAGIVDEILKLARQHNPSLNYLKHDEKVKKLLVEELKTKKGLQIELSSYLGKERYQSIYVNSVTKNLKYYVISATKPLYLPGFEHQVKQQKIDVDITKVNYESQLSNTNARVLLALAKGAAAEEKIKVLQKLQKLSQETLELYGELLKHRKIPKLALLQEKEQLLRYEILENRERQKLAASLKELNSYCGVQFEEIPAALKDSSASVKSFLKATKELEKVNSNSAILKASLEKKKAEEEFNYRKYLRYPKVSLNAYYSYTSSSAISTATRDARVFFSIDIPIYQGGYVSLARLEAKEKVLSLEDQKKQEEENLKLKKAQLEPEIVSLIREYQILKSKEAILQETYRLRKKSFSSRKETLARVLSAEIDIFENRLNELNVLEQLVETYLNFLDAADSAKEGFLKPIKEILLEKEIKFNSDTNNS